MFTNSFVHWGRRIVHGLVLFLILFTTGCNFPKAIKNVTPNPNVSVVPPSLSGDLSLWYVSPTGSDSANTCHTPQSPCKTIQWAIEHATDGAVVHIADGVYVERVEIKVNGVILEGSGPNTIIEAPALSGEEPDWGGIVNVECNRCNKPVNISNLTMRKGMASNGGVIAFQGFQVTMTNVTIQDGTGGFGGCIFIYNETAVTFDQIHVSGCHALQSGGGLFNGGELTLNNSTLSNNISNDLGGGLFNEGMAKLTGNLFEKNTAERFGGGIYNQTGNLTITTSTLKENEANDGGGLFNSSGEVNASATTVHGNKGVYGGGLSNQGEMYLADMTVSGNIADGGMGGGIENSGSTLFAASLTIVNNQSGGVYQSTGATMAFINTIVANNSDWNCYANPLAGGNNISSDASCIFTDYSSRSGLDPMLGPLQDNGGSTWTHALLPGSPAIDTGTNWLCPTIDQRGVSRPVGAQDDVGAYELEKQPLSIIPPILLIATNTPGPGNFTFQKSGNCRSGPGTVFPILKSAPTGVTVPVDGRNEAGDWFRLQMPNDVLCWVNAGIGTFDGNPLLLLVRESPATPTPTEVPPVIIVCSDYTSKNSCEAYPECFWSIPPTGGPGVCKNK